jgi:hypothetical protein
MRALVLRHVHAKAEIHDLSLMRISQRLSLRPVVGTRRLDGTALRACAAGSAHALALRHGVITS